MTSTISFLLVSISALLLITNCIGNNIDATNLGFQGPRIVPVTELELDSFVGRWYQMYSSLIPISTYEKDLVCIGADYTAVNSTAFTLTNFGRVGTPNGAQQKLSGTAVLPDVSEVGKWVVEIETGSTKKQGQFWVLHLGPKIAGKYDWSVVSDSKGINMFVLSRDPDVFRTDYDNEVTKLLTKDGFVGISAPIPSYQSSSCVY